MTNNFWNKAKTCVSCAKIRVTTARYHSKLKLFSAAGPLEFVAMHILGSMPRSTFENQFNLGVTDRFTKTTRAIPLKTTTATDVAMVFLTQWVYSHDLPLYLLTDSGNQFLSKFFSHFCATLGIKHVTTTAYRPQTKGQAKLFNKTLINRLVHYMAEHQLDWDD